MKKGPVAAVALILLFSVSAFAEPPSYCVGTNAEERLPRSGGCDFKNGVDAGVVMCNCLMGKPAEETAVPPPGDDPTRATSDWTDGGNADNRHHVNRDP